MSDGIREQRTPADLVINRVPIKTLREFQNFAANEFAGKNGIGDYGMALKWLWDFYKGESRDVKLKELHYKTEMLVQKLDMLEAVVMEQERNKEIKEEQEKDEEVETYLDGSPVK